MERIRVEEAVPVSEKEASQFLAQFLQSRPEPDDLKENLVVFNQSEDVSSAPLPANTFVQISFIQAAIEGQYLSDSLKSQKKHKNNIGKEDNIKKKKKRKKSDVADSANSKEKSEKKSKPKKKKKGVKESDTSSSPLGETETKKKKKKKKAKK
uniref:Uncharacterized protein n=1 Tax=Aplanochytrium stocchinoi TaxID=215587 RepID=A0A7S3LQ69_9STRA|mmetsp:Transcript_13290/g.16555  ORF Transcript_13290/g.16555 Transcript_13290/m.16555 type:complete len:153 (+) Transcript_13290:102-560(+)|eukprot:CAMPEP_0204833098 /NCGR_PEP_ID=MMETSP1346-20131115/15648_1 /ASSEMBLY_ACC=CAM_ASM_000771 /TAXON_ID=215587 /ORGANISM="Aplanochytrium stocchinoi, Strain GSBS06" /LENGTH=152 /DNA_ID=CAMNT_0051965359 /DNA_START=143 /DNA_END=601 /DNA_ORIENTATION=+